jgi:hypothetical protein
MVERKHTPNILDEVLAGVDESPVLAPAIILPSQPRKSRPTTRPTPQAKQVQSTGWEYQVVSFQEHDGWRARFVNGVELKNWMGGLLLHEYLAQMGKQDWELVAASAGERLYGFGDRHHLFFKRHL